MTCKVLGKKIIPSSYLKFVLYVNPDFFLYLVTDKMWHEVKLEYSDFPRVLRATENFISISVYLILSSNPKR